MLRRWLLVAALLLPAPAEELAAGKFLVADRALADKDFAHTIILLIYYGKDGAMGLVLNRPLDIPMSKLFPDRKGPPVRLYDGGPISSGVRMLFRSPTTPKDALHLFGDVYLTSTVDRIKDATGVFRVYVGCTGWSKGQLQAEVARGTWHLAPADAAVVFSKIR